MYEEDVFWLFIDCWWSKENIKMKKFQILNLGPVS